MSPSIFKSYKGGVLFAVFADYTFKFILTNFAKYAAIHEKSHLCDVIFWNSLCGFAMRCHMLDFLPARDPREWK